MIWIFEMDFFDFICENDNIKSERRCELRKNLSVIKLKPRNIKNFVFYYYKWT